MSSTNFIDNSTVIVASWLNDVNTVTYTTVPNLVSTKATAGANSDITSLLGLSGNLSFTGTGNRITGDFSNATPSSRVMFQTNATNSITAVHLVPNGSVTVGTNASNLILEDSTSITTGNGSIATNAMVQGTEYRLTSGARGTGTYLPMTFWTNNAERLRIDTGGGILFGNVTLTGTTGYVLKSNGPGASPSWQAGSGSGSITTSGYTQSTSRILGRTTAATGAIEELSAGIGITLSGGSISSQAVMPNITSSVTANALTLQWSAPGSVSFQYAGANYLANIYANNTITIPATASLGATSGVKTRLALCFLTGTGTLGVMNTAGGAVLDGTVPYTPVVINPTANSATTLYSVSGTTVSSIGILGFFDAVWTSGTGWANPSLTISTTTSAALMAGLGFGQKWQDVTASRALGTTYTNDTGRPIQVSVCLQSTGGGAPYMTVTTTTPVTITGTATGINIPSYISAIVPPGATYLVNNNTPTASVIANGWTELR